MNINDVIYKEIEKEEDLGCESKLINGHCPKERYLSKDCPFSIIKNGYKLCAVKKEA